MVLRSSPRTCLAVAHQYRLPHRPHRHQQVVVLLVVVQLAVVQLVVVQLVLHHLVVLLVTLTSLVFVQ